MISQAQLRSRLFKYFNIIYGADATTFGFATDENQRFLVDRQTNAPRIDDNTVLYFRIEENKPFGLGRGSARSRRDAITNREYVDVWKEVHVVVNVLSQSKGLAKDSVNFLLAAVNSERDYRASQEVLPFDLILHRISNDFRNLTDLETEAWQERIEFDMYFNYQDTIDLDAAEFLTQPTEATDVPSIIEWETTLKE